MLTVLDETVESEGEEDSRELEVHSVEERRDDKRDQKCGGVAPTLRLLEDV